MAETFIETGNSGVLNSSTPVTLVATPASSQRHVVRTLTICNRDTASVTLTVTLKDTGGTDAKIIDAVVLSVGDTWVWSEDIINLDTTTKSVTAVLAGAVSTNQPSFTASYALVQN